MLEESTLVKIGTEVKETLKTHPFDDFAIRLDSTSSRQVRFAKNEISIAKNWDETTLHVLTEKDERVSALELGLSGKEKIGEFLSQLVTYMEKAPKKENYAALPEPEETYPVLTNFDKTIVDNPEKLINYAKTTVDEGKRANIDYVAGAIQAKAINSVLLSSKGAEISEKRSSIYMDVRASAGEQAKGHSSVASAFLSDIDPQKVTSKAIDYAVQSKDPKQIEPGAYTTLFIPDATAGLLTWLGMMASAYAVQVGYSFLQKQGETIGDEKFTLVDDPHYPRGFNSRRFDDEGQPTQKNTIIQQGKLKNLLHNRFTAKSFDTNATSNAGWIRPHPWQLKVQPGKQSENEMIATIDDGLIVGNVTYLRFQNPMKGTLSAVIRDGVYRVKNGEIQHAVKGLRLSDSFPNILSNIRSIEDKQRQIMHWWLRVPVITGSLVSTEVNYTRPVK